MMNHGYMVLKIRREYIRVALMTASTAKDGGNADFAGAYICLAVNNLENHMDTANVISYLWFINSHVNQRSSRLLANTVDLIILPDCYLACLFWLGYTNTLH